MNTNRRRFLQIAGLSLGASGLFNRAPGAAEIPQFSKPSRMHLGLVTYDLAKDWDVPTIIRHCAATQFEGVELRTTHAHGVEISLPPARRAEVRKQFADSPVRLMGLGSTFDYHTPDQSKLRHDIAATKEYILLAQDVGASGVKVRPNGLPKDVPRETTLEQIGRSLREIGEFGAQHGIQIRLEIHGNGTSLLPNIKTIMDAANHPNVGVCWNSNATDLAGDGFDHNFDLVKDRIFSVHLHDLSDEKYPFRRLFSRLNGIGFSGFTLAEIPPSQDPTRVMQYFRALWLAYQDLL